MTIDYLKFGSIFDASGEAVFGVGDGAVRFMNPRARELFGNRDPLETVPLKFAEAPEENLCFTTEIDGKNYSVSAACSDGLWLFCLRGEEETEADNGIAVNISGQISNSVMGIRAAVTALGERMAFKGVDAGDYGSIIYREIFRLQRLSENLKMLGGASGMYLRKAPHDMAELIGNLVDSVNHFFGGRIGLDISAGGRTLMAQVDEDRVTQMVLNVLTNSISRMEEGSRVTVSLRESGGRIVITVRDNCGGIPPEVLGSVFAKYSMSDISGLADGAGVGLAAAQCIARAHGGTVLLESRCGVGTTVSMILPASDGSSVRSPGRFMAHSGMELLLTGLSCVLGREFYNEKYLD